MAAERRSPLRTLLLVAVLLAVGGAAGYYFAHRPATGTATATSAPTTREFYIFSGGLDFNESAVGLPHDMFVPDHIAVNKGDTVTVHFYNLEDTTEHHTFTMDAPYARSVDVAPGQHADITFVANVAGVFEYRCIVHQPTMTGQLVVLG